MYRIILAGLLGLSATACNSEPAEEAEQVRVTELQQPDQRASGSFEAEGKGIAIVSGSQAISIDVSLPSNIDNLDPALARLIRERADVDTEAMIESAEIDKREAEEGGFTFRPHTLDVEWTQVGPTTGRLVSYFGTYFTYAGGAHPNTNFQLVNWDLEASEEISFDDLFEDADAARDTIRDALFERILIAKRERLTDIEMSDEEILNSWVRPAFEANNEVYEFFTFAAAADSGEAAGLLYHFEPYDIGAYAEGAYEISIPASVFADELAADYADAFSTAPLVSEN